MKRLACLFFGTMLSLTSSFSLAADSDTFVHTGVGFQVTKPAEWTYVTAAQNAENINAMKLSDEERKQALLKMANAALVAMTKFPEPYPDLNVSFRVSFRPFGNLKGKPVLEIMSMLLPQMQRSMKDFVLAQAPVEVLVSGISSAYFRVNHTFEIRGGSTFPATSEMWIVPRGDYFFLINAGTRQDEKTGSREEVQAILKTVKIEQWSAK